MPRPPTHPYRLAGAVLRVDREDLGLVDNDAEAQDGQENASGRHASARAYEGGPVR